MKKMVDVGWGVAVLSGLVFLSCTACFGEKTADPYTWDFGKIKQGEVVSHKFTLKNGSAKALKITSLTTSCGCTVSEVKKRDLLPNESTEVEAKFNSKGYSGAVQQFIFVNTDYIGTSAKPSADGERSRTIDKPVIRFIIKADVAK